MHDDWMTKDLKQQEEIIKLKTNQVVVDDDASKKLKIQVASLSELLQNNKVAYSHKSDECDEYIDLVKTQANDIH